MIVLNLAQLNFRRDANRDEFGHAGRALKKSSAARPFGKPVGATRVRDLTKADWQEIAWRDAAPRRNRGDVEMGVIGVAKAVCSLYVPEWFGYSNQYLMWITWRDILSSS
jgi:hypothetical protein